MLKKEFQIKTQKLFYNLGRKFGSSLVKGKWYYKSVFGSEAEAVEAENIMGKELARKVIQGSRLSEDIELRTLLNEIKSALCERVTDKKRNFQFGILDSSDVNAFALPGGFIFLTDSLIKLTNSNRDEIAFVLAHEIIHVMLKHPFNRIVADFSSNIISNLVTRGGALTALAKKALSDLLSKSYSRDKEFEADSYAVRLMYSAGFDTSAAKILLGKLKGHTPEDIPIYCLKISRTRWTQDRCCVYRHVRNYVSR